MNRVCQRGDLLHPGTEFCKVALRFTQQPRPAAGVWRQLVSGEQIAGMSKSQRFESTTAAL
ncbi:hypothetical protein KPZU09_34360 [Klebsiella pneumoniae]|uniref:Uncharacterized protein n=2 Tax=Klebsiella pneumoniae TaxID=573 RepID=A0A919HTP7_KLEPN|nr:hypothetical protein KPZU09_34360 [Klebsiella pneumoniae]CDL08006.1 hypothetical protein [Klebsiella pneumoniae IS43]